MLTCCELRVLVSQPSNVKLRGRNRKAATWPILERTLLPDFFLQRPRLVAMSGMAALFGKVLSRIPVFSGCAPSHTMPLPGPMRIWISGAGVTWFGMLKSGFVARQRRLKFHRLERSNDLDQMLSPCKDLRIQELMRELAKIKKEREEEEEAKKVRLSSQRPSVS